MFACATLDDARARTDFIAGELQRLKDSGCEEHADIEAAATPFNDNVRLILASRCVSALANAAPKDEQASIRTMADFNSGKASTTEELLDARRNRNLQSEDIARQFTALSRFEQTGTVPKDY